jgi:hypothetical protein
VKLCKRVRFADSDVQTNKWTQRRQISKDTYTVEDFEYLLNTTHTDPDDGLKYVVKAIRQERGLIVVDRALEGSTRIDTVHARDIAHYYDNSLSPVQRVRSGSVGTAAQGRLLTGGPDGSRGVAGKAPAGIAAAAGSCPAGQRRAILKRPAETPIRRRSGDNRRTT